MRVELPGFGEAMRMKSFETLPNAILSRSLAAVVDDSLVIALPAIRRALWTVCRSSQRPSLTP
jgi:molybdopterin biosynthesis enzyme MoaB